MTRKPKQPKALWTPAFPEQVKTKPKAKRKPIRKQSPAQAKRMREYNKAVREWKKGRECAGAGITGGFSIVNGKHVCLPVCYHNSHLAEDCHHMKGRGKYLMDKSTWLPLCRKAHAWVHAHPKEATARGWMESRA